MATEQTGKIIGCTNELFDYNCRECCYGPNGETCRQIMKILKLEFKYAQVIAW